MFSLTDTDKRKLQHFSAGFKIALFTMRLEEIDRMTFYIS